MKKIITILIVMMSWSLAAFSGENGSIQIDTKYSHIALSKPAVRVLALEYSFMDSLIKLGIKPLAIAEGQAGEGLIPPYLANDLEGLPTVGTRHEPNLESILKLKPDVIIADPFFNVDIKSQLEKIAPTIMMDGITGGPNQQVENMKILAKVVGKEGIVNDAVAEFETKFAKLKETGKSKESSVLIGYVHANGVYRALTANAIATEFLGEIGLNNVITSYSDRQSTALTLEGIIAKNPDKIIVLTTDGDMGPYNAFSKSPLWKRVSAVKNNQVYFLDRDIWGKSHGIMANMQKIDDMNSTIFAGESNT